MITEFGEDRIHVRISSAAGVKRKVFFHAPFAALHKKPRTYKRGAAGLDGLPAWRWQTSSARRSKSGGRDAAPYPGIGDALPSGCVDLRWLKSRLAFNPLARRG